MAQMPDKIKTAVEVSLVLVQPGDTLILGIKPDQLRGMSEMELHNIEQMTRNRLPGLADCLVVPADLLAAYRPGKESDDGQTRDHGSTEGDRRRRDAGHPGGPDDGRPADHALP